MEVKKCYNCREDKPIEGFSKNKSRPDGFNSQCKMCHSTYRKDRYLKNKEREKGQNQKYRDSNSIPTTCNYCDTPLRRYRTNVGGDKNNFCDTTCSNYFHERGFDSMKGYLSKSKKRARAVNLDFNLDKEYLDHLFYETQKEKCDITSIPLLLIKEADVGTLKNTASIDRIDNSKGYIKGNVRFVCLGLNYLKNRRPDKEVFDLLDNILIHYKSRSSVNGSI